MPSDHKRMVKYKIIIQETNGNSKFKYPELTRELNLPLDSQGKHIYRQISRANKDLMYQLIDYGYLNPTRAIYDLLQYEEQSDKEEKE